MIDYTLNRANKTKILTCVNISLAASISLCDVMQEPASLSTEIAAQWSGDSHVSDAYWNLTSARTTIHLHPTTAQREIMAKSNSDSLDGLALEGICSLLDTDLYKLTMQCAVLRSYPNAGWFARREDCFSGNLRLIWGSRLIDVTYAFTNRTPDLKITRAGFEWLQLQCTSSFR